jgi:alkylglycerol monooxygenase
MEYVLRDLGALFYIVPLQAESGVYLSAADVPDYVSRAVPYFLLLIALECVYGKFRMHKLYSLKDTVMSISLGIVQQLVGVWMKEMLILPYAFVYHLFAPARQYILQSGYWPGFNGHQYDVLMFVVGFLGCDLGYYFLHRTAHEWQLMWSAHSVHHSGERYNLATALRQGSFQATYSWFFYIPLAAMGLPITHFIRHNRLNTVYQFWIHTEVVGRFHWLIELIMNTAPHHRLHHRPPGNCNYAGVLIIWDRLFCTFQSEYELPKTKLVLRKGEAVVTDISTAPSKEEDAPTTYRGVIYGLARPLNNYDPVYANVCHLLRLCEPKSGDGAEANSKGDSAGFLSRYAAPFSVFSSKGCFTCADLRS